MKSRTALAFALLTALSIALPAAPGRATHRGAGKGCAGTGVALTNPAAGQDNVDDGEIKKYKVVLGAGETGYFMLQPFNGDVDVYVCKVGGGDAHPCASPNMIPLGDGCHFEELDLWVPDENGQRVMDWGNALQQPGTYWIHVQACWSSVDQPDGAAQGVCDYSELVGLDPGTLDPLPPVEYVYAWAVN